MTKHKAVFLFGAGASVPAGGKTSFDISSDITNILKQDPIIERDFPWIFPLWEFLVLFSRGFNDESEIKLPWGETRSLIKFFPNFEHLIYLIESLDTHMNNSSGMEELKHHNNGIILLREILSNFNHKYLEQAIVQSFLNLETFTVDPIFKIHNPPITIKGTIDFLLARNAVLQSVTNVFPRINNLSHLKGFHDFLIDPKISPIIATTNYDLVFENFFDDASLDYQDGFSSEHMPAEWRGFNEGESKIKYFKLHGSLNWFHLHEGILLRPFNHRSSNNVYKINPVDISGFLNNECREKIKQNNKIKFEFNSPHIIIGEGKDRKISNNPFIEIYRQWQNALASAHTLVIVGLSVSDTHLIDQIRALLSNNKILKKVIIINPDRKTCQSFQFLLSDLRLENPPEIYIIESGWDVSNLNKLLKLSLSEMILLEPVELNSHFSAFPKQST